MTLRQLLITLSTANVNAILIDLDTNNEITTIKASGVDSLEDALEARPVKFWSIISTSQVKVVLGQTVENTTDTTPTENAGTNG